MRLTRSPVYRRLGAPELSGASVHVRRPYQPFQCAARALRLKERDWSGGHRADIACRATAELSPPVTKRLSGKSKTGARSVPAMLTGGPVKCSPLEP